MKQIKKTFCELNKSELKKYEQEIVQEIRQPRYMCKKCVRVSSSKELLCKPQKL